MEAGLSRNRRAPAGGGDPHGCLRLSPRDPGRARDRKGPPGPTLPWAPALLAGPTPPKGGGRPEPSLKGPQEVRKTQSRQSGQGKQTPWEAPGRPGQALQVQTILTHTLVSLFILQEHERPLAHSLPGPGAGGPCESPEMAPSAGGALTREDAAGGRFMVLTHLKSTSQLFYRMSISVGLSEVFS